MESDWTDVQYLWRMHPIFDWVDDRAGLLCRHDEAPLALVTKLPRHTTMYLMNGSIPNRKSTPLVDEWFGVLVEGGACVKILPMREALAKCGCVLQSMKLSEDGDMLVLRLCETDGKRARASFPRNVKLLNMLEDAERDIPAGESVTVKPFEIVTLGIPMK